MSTRPIHRLTLAAIVAAMPALAHAQPAAPNDSVRVAVFLEGVADRPEFAAQRAATVLQNAAEVARQLGGRVSKTDTVAYGVTRLPEVNGLGSYPPPPYVARYVLRLSVAPADVMDVTAALSAASRGVVGVRVLSDLAAR